MAPRGHEAHDARDRTVRSFRSCLISLLSGYVRFEHTLGTGPLVEPDAAGCLEELAEAEDGSPLMMKPPKSPTLKKSGSQANVTSMQRLAFSTSPLTRPSAPVGPKYPSDT
jgi:hypothetical protein